MKKNTLTMTEHLKMADELRKLAEPIQQGKYTRAELAAILTTELTFTVSENNVSAILDACGIVMPRKKAKPKVTPSAKLDAMLEIVAEVEQRMDAFASRAEKMVGADEVAGLTRDFADLKKRMTDLWDSLEKRVARLEFQVKAIPAKDAVNGLQPLAGHTTRK